MFSESIFLDGINDSQLVSFIRKVLPIPMFFSWFLNDLATDSKE